LSLHHVVVRIVVEATDVDLAAEKIYNENHIIYI
jgi:hypothetical protein